MPNYYGPLSIDASGRFLRDGGGQPFRWQFDAGWLICTELTLSDLRTYLDARKAQGFTGILFQMTNPVQYASGNSAPACVGAGGALPFSNNVSGGTWDGDPTFATDRTAHNPAPGNFDADIGTANPTYFAWIDKVLDEMAARSMYGAAVPHYNGFDRGAQDGWWRTFANNTNAKATALGTFLGNRYKDRWNLIWVEGVDMTPSVEAGPSDASTIMATKVIDGIKATGDAHLWCGHWKASRISTDDSAFSGYMDLQAVYTHGPYPTNGPTYGRSKVAYATSPARPCFLIETAYEGEHSTTAAQDRANMWWAHLTCINGVTCGVANLWEFSSGWPTLLGSTLALGMRRMADLLDNVPWWKLRPSGLGGMRALVTSGGGTEEVPAAPGDFESGGLDYVTAAADPAGACLLAYVPHDHSGSFTVDVSAMAGQYLARWFDPSPGGGFTAIGTFLNAGTKSFTIPGANVGGANDWVLVLESAPYRARQAQPDLGAGGSRSSSKVL